MKCVTSEVTSPIEILANDHYVGIPYTVSATGIAANAEGKKIVPAGTILPKNDATAKGILLHDTDVTYGDRGDTIVIHGSVKTAKLPVAPDPTAITALKEISFLA